MARRPRARGKPKLKDRKPRGRLGGAGKHLAVLGAQKHLAERERIYKAIVKKYGSYGPKAERAKLSVDVAKRKLDSVISSEKGIMGQPKPWTVRERSGKKRKTKKPIKR